MDATRIHIPERVALRAKTKYTSDVTTGCMISTYSTGSHGYAQIGWNEAGERVVTLVHRIVWASTHGPIPQHLTVDHMCKNRQCMNIEHLRLLSNYENARRTDGRDWPLGRCINGHPNIHLKTYEDGRTHCSVCVDTIWKSRPKGANPRKPKVVKLPTKPRTHCRNGHEKSEANTYLRPSGRRECLPCKRDSARTWHQGREAA